MRRGLFFVQRRAITGVAPTIFIPKTGADKPLDQQVERNTQSALELIRTVKGPKPAPYTRKYTQSFDQLSREVESLLGGASKLRRQIKDNEPLDKLGAMERALRHAMWSYLKDEGKADFEQLEKWLVYTQTDQTRFQQLKAEQEKKERYAVFRRKREANPGAPSVTLPTFNLEQEYDNVVDREVVVEKRLRYDTLGRNTTQRNDSVIEAELASYLKPTQEKRLDQIVDMLEKFKPMLAREAILQRLTIKHLEGQLGIWRYLDWNPEVRDRAELETDNYASQWWQPHEEKRLASVRVCSKNEMSELIEKNQARRAAERPTARVAASGDNAQAQARDKLLAEIIRLQQRIGRKDADEEGGDKKADGDKKAAAPTNDADQFKVNEQIVADKGLLGLDFLSAQEKVKA